MVTKIGDWRPTDVKRTDDGPLGDGETTWCDTEFALERMTGEAVGRQL